LLYAAWSYSAIVIGFEGAGLSCAAWSCSAIVMGLAGSGVIEAGSLAGTDFIFDWAASSYS